MKYKQANGFPARILLSLPFWFSEVLWMRHQASLVKDWREKRCPLSFHIPAPLTCLWALSPNVAPPPAGKFEELQSSAVTPKTHLKKDETWEFERNQVEKLQVPHVFLWQPDKSMEAFFRLEEGLRRKWGSLSQQWGPEESWLRQFISRGGTIAPDEQFGSDGP